MGEEDAYSMVKRLIYGSALLMEESKESPVTLRENVTSKKGLTFEALKVLEEGGQEKLYSDAIDAAYKRARELEDQES